MCSPKQQHKTEHEYNNGDMFRVLPASIEKDNICKDHRDNKFLSMKSSASFSKIDHKQAQTHRGKKKRRQKCKAEKDDSESRIIELIQKFRKRHMTRLEVWGCGFLKL